MTDVDTHDGTHQDFGQEVCGVHEQKLSVTMDSKRWPFSMASWGIRHQHTGVLLLEFYEV
jgi:hypothetical protein